MVFHIFFITISVSKRKYSQAEVSREKRRNDILKKRRALRDKQIQNFRVM